MSTPTDDLLDRAARMLAQLRTLSAEDAHDGHVDELLTDGFATALALEGARRRLRTRALALSERELVLAARERELRELLGALRRSRHEPAPQRLHRRLQPALGAELGEDVGDVVLDGVRADEQLGGDPRVVATPDDQPQDVELPR